MAEVPLIAYRIETDLCEVDGCEKQRVKSDKVGSRFCQGHRWRFRSHGDVMADVPLRERRTYDSDVCEVDGCEKQRAKGSGFCWGHLSRLRTRGDVSAGVPLRHQGGGNINSNGYWQDFNPEHPLAAKRGYVLRHRAVLYEALGPGEHPCHWCGKLVPWMLLARARFGLQVDHLDGNRQHFDRSNLVPSCGPCNRARARAGNPINWTP